jgi:hypothetical protein
LVNKGRLMLRLFFSAHQIRQFRFTPTRRAIRQDQQAWKENQKYQKKAVLQLFEPHLILDQFLY